jgi:outer membrane protein OmpA-like peptidoglycan-associated protein
VFEPSIGDRDGDGVKDDVDSCPDVPEDRDGFRDEDGCPDPDNDDDHFLDKDDRCPNEPETPNGFVDDDGCPDTAPVPPPQEHEKEKEVVTFEDNVGIFLEPIQFEYDSPNIKKESLPIVDGAAKILNAHPEFVLVEIEGHADERGNDVYNLQLTQKRVEAVRAALVQRGVAASRLRAKSYGEYCPLDEAHTEAAWAKNRRVELRVVKTDKGATGVKLGCDAAAKKGVVPLPVP